MESTRPQSEEQGARRGGPRGHGCAYGVRSRVGGQHRSASQCRLVRTGALRNCTDGNGLYGRGLRGVPVGWLSYRWKHRSAQPTSVESGLKAHMRLPAVERRDLTIRVKNPVTRQYTPIVLEVASKLTRIPNTICINLTVCLFVGLNLSPKVKN